MKSNEEFFDAGNGHEFLIVELGGTVGDIEGLPFMEAIREVRHELPKTNTNEPSRYACTLYQCSRRT